MAHIYLSLLPSHSNSQRAAPLSTRLGRPRAALWGQPGGGRELGGGRTPSSGDLTTMPARSEISGEALNILCAEGTSSGHTHHQQRECLLHRHRLARCNSASQGAGIQPKMHYNVRHVRQRYDATAMRSMPTQALSLQCACANMKYYVTTLRYAPPNPPIDCTNHIRSTQAAIQEGSSRTKAIHHRQNLSCSAINKVRALRAACSGRQY